MGAQRCPTMNHISETLIFLIHLNKRFKIMGEKLFLIIVCWSINMTQIAKLNYHQAKTI